MTNPTDADREAAREVVDGISMARFMRPAAEKRVAAAIAAARRQERERWVDVGRADVDTLRSTATSMEARGKHDDAACLRSVAGYLVDFTDRMEGGR